MDVRIIEERMKKRIPILALFDVKIVKAEEGNVILEIKHDPVLEREGGILFGGVIALLFDATLGLTVFTVNDGEDQATVSLSVEYLKPAKSEKYVVEGKVVKKGKRIVFVEGTLGDGRDIFARAHGIWYIKRSR